MLDEKTKELVAIGAAIAANCQPCLDYHVAKAREQGVTSAEILAAIEVAQRVRRAGASKTDSFAAELMRNESSPVSNADCGA